MTEKSCKVVRVGRGDFRVTVGGRRVDVAVDDAATEAYGGAKWGLIVKYPRRLGGPRLVLFDTRGQAEKALHSEKIFGRNAPACVARIK